MVFDFVVSKQCVFVAENHIGPCRTVADKHEEIQNSWPSETPGWFETGVLLHLSGITNACEFNSALSSEEELQTTERGCGIFLDLNICMYTGISEEVYRPISDSPSPNRNEVDFFFWGLGFRV
jgi:hypothetical protein